ncbi:putative collagen-binding domain-containing protein [Petrimonas sp.]|uniref:putative collagen-binding domain-containing protein n=1 Tax=Petrimonas sp. TaxID=2023866 RepID=UPI003F519D82
MLGYYGLIQTQGINYVFVYLPNGNNIDISLETLPKAKRLKLYWFDPRTGKKTYIRRVPAKGKFTTKAPTTGYGCDWILIVEQS